MFFTTKTNESGESIIGKILADLQVRNDEIEEKYVEKRAEEALKKDDDEEETSVSEVRAPDFYAAAKADEMAASKNMSDAEKAAFLAAHFEQMVEGLKEAMKPLEGFMASTSRNFAVVLAEIDLVKAKLDQFECKAGG